MQKFNLWVFAGIFLMFAIPAFASLGKNEASIADDCKLFSGTLTSIQNDKYTEYTCMSDEAIIKEYLSQNGADSVVFGVSWSKARIPPKLVNLLGNYYEEFKKSKETENQKFLDNKRSAQIDSSTKSMRPRMRGRVAATSDNLIYEHGGQMGNLHGRVVIPKLLPAGVAEEVVP